MASRKMGIPIDEDTKGLSHYDCFMQHNRRDMNRQYTDYGSYSKKPVIRYLANSANKKWAYRVCMLEGLKGKLDMHTFKHFV